VVAQDIDFQEPEAGCASMPEALGLGLSAAAFQPGLPAMRKALRACRRRRTRCGSGISASRLSARPRSATHPSWYPDIRRSCDLPIPSKNRMQSRIGHGQERPCCALSFRRTRSAQAASSRLSRCQVQDGVLGTARRRSNIFAGSVKARVSVFCNRQGASGGTCRQYRSRDC
jgi:hypothetical protein